MNKKPKIWIYEYKDDDTPIGSTFMERFVDEIDEEIKLPHLHPDWHWRIQMSWVEKDKDED